MVVRHFESAHLTHVLDKLMKDMGRFRPGIIIGINQNGYFVAESLAGQLGSRKDQAIVGERGVDRVYANPIQGHFLRYERVLVVSERLKSGRSMEVVETQVAEHADQVKTLCIYYDIGSKIIPNFSWRMSEPGDEIHFFWEREWWSGRNDI